MKLPSKAVRLTFGILAAALVLGGPGVVGAEEAPAETGGRRVDLEIGTGFILGIGNNSTIDDTWGVEINAVVELHRRFDLEFGAGWGPGETPDSADVDHDYDLYNVGGGVRWYPTTDPGVTIRPYLVTGVRYFNELKGANTTPAGAYVGPGLRIELGERSGVTAKVPLWFSFSGQTDTLMLPTLTWFYSF